VKEEVYTSQEVLYVAATDAIGAQMGWVAGDTHETTGEAWNSLSYWDQQERTDEFDVYEVVTEVKIKKVEPPYA
jgi:hypothetical protein